MHAYLAANFPEEASAAQVSREQTSRKTLAICPEIVCHEEPDGSRTVEATPELERAMDIARFGMSAAQGRVDMRLAQARALLDLAEFAGRAREGQGRPSMRSWPARSESPRSKS